MTYDRELLVNTLIYHQRTNSGGCLCGWDKLGASHPEHLADVYEHDVTKRMGR